MTIERGWNTIETPSIVATAAIQAEDAEGRHLLSNLNTLDEGLADRGAPGASAQLYFGHDHGLEGGAPIIRGMSFCADGGGSPILTFGFISGAPRASALGLSVASPGLNPDGRQRYQLDFKYKALRSAFSLSLNHGDPVVVEESEEAAVARWATVYGAIPGDDWLTLANAITVTPASNYLTAQLVIYSIILMETYEKSQYIAGTVDVPDNAGNYTVYSWPNAKLASELVPNSGSLDALTVANATMRANAIFEHTLDRPAMGAVTQRIQGHDHYPSGYGGRPVPMGTIYRCRTWDNNLPLWSQTCTTQNTWYYFDENASSGARRTTAGSTPGGTVTANPMILAHVTYGFSSSGNPPSAAPYFIGCVEIRHPAAPTAVIEIRWFNLTTGEHSAVGTGGAASDETVVSMAVPCAEGVTNRFAIEVRCTSAAGVLVDKMGAGLFEVESYAGTNAAYVASIGSSPVAVANEFRRY